MTDTSDPVWDELEKMVFTPREHEQGYTVPMSGVTIDASDGQTNDAVYHWVREMKKKYPGVKVLAGKGASSRVEREIFSLPRSSIDHKSTTKAAKYGLRVYIIGTHKAKDLFTARLQLDGAGPGRVHFYSDVRSDYYDQITSEVKAPSRKYRGKKAWQVKSGRRNEGLDCEVYALHAARALKVHLNTPEKWDKIHSELQQADLFAAPASNETTSNNQQPYEDSYGNDYGSVESGNGWLG